MISGRKQNLGGEVIQATETEHADDDEAFLERHLRFPDDGHGENEGCEVGGNVQGGVDGVQFLLVDTFAGDGVVPEGFDRSAAEGSGERHGCADQ